MKRYAKLIKIAAGIVAGGAVLLLAAHYRVGVATWVLASSAPQSSHDHGARASAPGEKKILYWYDSMNPAFHSDKPGKAPDGMDLVPKYADSESPSTGQSAQPAAGPSPAGSEKKILYWYDGMNPAFRSDKPGKAPDGMDLVPRYADAEDSGGDRPPGSVKISSTNSAKREA